jgi:hypothetical protein
MKILEFFNDLLPDNDGVDDFLKSLDIPAQETCSNVPISKAVDVSISSTNDY